MNPSQYTNVTGSILSAGNYTIDDGTAQEQLYFCIRTIGSELTDQSYSTSDQGAWTVRILLVAITYRRRRKKKKAVKVGVPATIFTKDLGYLEALVKYLKENLGMSYSVIAELLNRDQRTIWTAYKKASEKQKEPISVKETEIFIPISILGDREFTIREAVISYLRTKGLRHSEIAKLLNRDPRNVWTRIKKSRKRLPARIHIIPSTIFSKDLGTLEAVVKYMKNNLGMSYSVIAQQLSRDQRTIWTAYKKASEKQKEPITVKETEIFIPIEILANRKLTLLESITLHLKDLEIKNSEIAEIIQRDSRNIWKTHKSALKKLKGGNNEP